MQAIEMVSRPSLSTADQTKTAIKRNELERGSVPATEERRQCRSRRQVVLDAFDKVILEYPDQLDLPQPV